MWFHRYTLTLMLTVTALKTTVTSSHEPPFYEGTALNLTCNVDLPDTVDPQIITNIKWRNAFTSFPSYYSELGNVYVIGETLNFNPLRKAYRLNSIYSCKVMLRGQRSAMNHDESQSLIIVVRGNHGMHKITLHTVDILCTVNQYM